MIPSNTNRSFFFFFFFAVFKVVVVAVALAVSDGDGEGLALAAPATAPSSSSGILMLMLKSPHRTRPSLSSRTNRLATSLSFTSSDARISPGYTTLLAQSRDVVMRCVPSTTNRCSFFVFSRKPFPSSVSPQVTSSNTAAAQCFRSSSRTGTAGKAGGEEAESGSGASTAGNGAPVAVKGVTAARAAAAAAAAAMIVDQEVARGRRMLRGAGRRARATCAVFSSLL
mmetsp:Transcript_79500/g.155568  ORF Transcript_79500/g.155568 Transcript_79500/m.155568 type:complete len:226 (-) Transcript_79500:343-1020(-)